MGSLRSDRLRWDRPIGRAEYFGAGLALFALKYVLDLAVARGLFGRPWSPINYLRPGETLSIALRTPEDQVFLGAMLAVALPFLTIGLALTHRRVIAAGLPGWLVLLFFVPMVNLLFFAVLCVVPSRPATKFDGAAGSPIADDPGTWPEPSRVEIVRVPDAKAPPPSSIPAILLPAPFAFAATFLGTTVLRDYGWGLFLGIPFAVGLASAAILGRRAPAGVGRCLGVGQLALLAYGGLLLTVALEGLICLVMAWPIAAVSALFGSLVGWALQVRPDGRGAAFRAMAAVLAALPTLMGAERLARPEPTLFAVRTAVEVDADPGRVWRHVVAFGDLPPPTDWLLRSGIAYPTHAEIDGRGVGAVRRCVFSTGTFVEPIEVWDEPRLLKFSVASSPPPMREWSPWADVRPPHLENFLVSKAGQFRLVPLPGGRTRLEGTTWYHHNMSPPGYWRIFSDLIIHRIHARVLDHVKALAEAG